MRHRYPVILVLACGLLTTAGFAQETRPPQRPAQGATQKDEVLATIRAAVEPDPAQMERIVVLYRALRDEQTKAFRSMREQFRRGGGGRDAPDRDSGRDRTSQRNGGMQAARQQMREHMTALNDGFLADCRALLRPEQIEAWDDCAADLNLMPRGRGGGGPNRAAGPELGTVAPGFELRDLEGRTVTLASLRGKPVVLEFGSYTCPIFRGKVNDIEAMRRAYGDAVHWILVYTREAHPTDGRVSRANVRDGIEIPQHVSIEKRLEIARICREKTGVTFPILVDGLDDKVTQAYGGLPNRGYVLDAEGRVVSKQTWIEADEVRRALDGVLGRSRGEPELIIDPERPK